jgi:glyoxylase I family protein
MRIEHVAYNAVDPVNIAAWYVRHLGWRICKAESSPPYAHFLADSSGQVMVEIYHNPAAPVPDYRAMNPLVFHIGLVCGPELAEVRQRLLTAGASDAGGVITTASGDRVAMLRDPWGLPIQLCDRKKPINPI